MQNEYIYNGEKFRFKANTLLLKDNGADLLFEFRKLYAFYSKDIDRTAEQKYSQKLKDYSIAYEQLKEMKENGDESVSERADELKLKLDNTQREHDNDEDIKLIKSLEAIANETAIYKLLLKRDLLKKVFSAMLEGDLTKIDFNEDSNEFNIFLMKLIADFFFFMNPT